MPAEHRRHERRVQLPVDVVLAAQPDRARLVVGALGEDGAAVVESGEPAPVVGVATADADRLRYRPPDRPTNLLPVVGGDHAIGAHHATISTSDDGTVAAPVGQLVPAGFMPEPLATVAAALPFRPAVLASAAGRGEAGGLGGRRTGRPGRRGAPEPVQERTHLGRPGGQFAVPEGRPAPVSAGAAGSSAEPRVGQLVHEGVAVIVRGRVVPRGPRESRRRHAEVGHEAPSARRCRPVASRS